MMAGVGCLSAPEPAARPEAVPAPQPATNASPDTGWGQLIGEPDLDRLIQQALASAPDLKAARAAQQASVAATDAVGALKKPLSTAIITPRAGRENQASTQFKTEDLEPFKSSARISWDPDVFGQIRARIKSAEAAEQLTAYQLADMELRRAALIVSDVVRGRFLLSQEDNRERVVKASKSILAWGESRLQAGLMKESELEAMRADSLMKEQALEQTRQSIDVFRSGWNYLLSTNDAPIEWMSSDSSINPTEPAPKNILHEQTLRRPDVAAAYASWAQADHAAAAASRARRPSISIEAAATGEGPSPIHNPEEWIAWAGVKLTLPLW
ncbi:MAG: TolC family protein, partial [Verrucomicrobiota bacterium]